MRHKLFVGVFVAALMLCVAPLRAQMLDAFKQQLAKPAASAATLFGQARVTVTEHGDAARIVSEVSRAEHKLHVEGHRVCIFSDNGPNAREEAFAAKELFETTYPGIKVYAVSSPPPYFRVTIGNCLTREEAIILMNKVLPTFPKAYLMSERLSLSDFLD